MLIPAALILSAIAIQNVKGYEYLRNSSHQVQEKGRNKNFVE